MIRGIVAIVILDLKRFWKEKTRLIAGLIQPLLYLFVLGAGIGASGAHQLDVLRRRKVRLARAEIGHVDALLFQLVRCRHDHHRRRRGDAVHAL